MSSGASLKVDEEKDIPASQQLARVVLQLYQHYPGVVATDHHHAFEPLGSNGCQPPGHPSPPIVVNETPFRLISSINQADHIWRQ